MAAQYRWGAIPALSHTPRPGGTHARNPVFRPISGDLLHTMSRYETRTAFRFEGGEDTAPRRFEGDCVSQSRFEGAAGTAAQKERGRFRPPRFHHSAPLLIGGAAPLPPLPSSQLHADAKLGKLCSFCRPCRLVGSLALHAGFRPFHVAFTLHVRKAVPSLINHLGPILG